MKRNKGINLDASPIDQERSTTRYVNNAVLERDLDDLRNEGGTELELSLRQEKRILGSVLLPNNSKVLFIHSKSVLLNLDRGEIGILSSSGTYTPLVQNNATLAFKADSFVKGTYVVNSKGEIIVIWVDDIHPIRKYNITLNPGITSEVDVSLIPLASSFTNITVDSINNFGGVLTTGTYFISVALQNESGAETNFSEIEGPIYINEENYGTNNDSYDGTPGGEYTSKSISVTISGIDTSYEKLKIAVVQFQNGVLMPTKIMEVSIQGTTQQVTISGNNYSNETSIEDVVIDSILYKKAKSLAQVDSQIYFANLEFEKINLQEVANAIQVEFEINSVTDSTNANGFKSPIAQYQLRTFQRDEVYAFYVSFVLANNSETEKFHIPGRLPIQTPVTGVFETDPVTAFNFPGSPYEAEAQSILAFDPNAKIFQYFNFLDSNKTAYWENENERYPASPEWGGLQNELVRHHRVPDPQNVVINLYPVQNAAMILGVSFKNINIPQEYQDKIIGVKFHAAKRNDTNSLVVDNMFANAGYTEPTTIGGQPADILYVHPIWALRTDRPQAVYRNDLLCGKPVGIMNGKGNFKTASYVKNFSSINQLDTVQSMVYNASPAISDRRGVIKDYTLTPWTTMVSPESKYRAITNSELFEFNVENKQGSTYYGDWKGELKENESRLVLKLNSGITEPISTGSIITMNPSRTFLVYLYRGVSNLYGPFQNQETFYLGSIPSNSSQTPPLFKGDCVMSKYTHKNFVQDGFTNTSLERFNLFMLITSWYEGIYNPSMREEGEDKDKELYYPKTQNTSKFIPTVSDDCEAYTEYYKVNEDYNKINDLKQGAIYRLDTASDGKLFTRIARTEKYEGFSDTYRILLPDNYLDLQRNRGEIVDINSFNNIIIAHLERALVVTRGKEQIQINDTNTAYLGSGDLFATKPDEVIMTDEGFAGTQNITSCLVFPGGYVFVDRKARKIYMFTNQIAEISSKGLSEWFDRNLIVELEKYGFEFPDEPTDFFALSTGYDPFNKRILITKKDLKGTALFNSLVVEEVPTGGTPESDYIFYDTETKKFYRFSIETMTSSVIEYSDTRYFRPKDWTISFSTDSLIWVSYHDYHPRLYIKDLNSFKSAELNNLWKHDVLTNMGKVYGNRVNFVVEFVDNMEGESFYTPSFDIRTTCLNQQGGKELFTTFSSFYVYNSFQLSPETEILHLDTARALRDTWVVNKFRDLKSNPAVQIVNSDFSINDSDIDTNTPWYEQRRFLDNYVIIRLIYNNADNNLLILHSATSNIKKSYR
jgi:hypothetical protein